MNYRDKYSPFSTNERECHCPAPTGQSSGFRRGANQNMKKECAEYDESNQVIKKFFVIRGSIEDGIQLPSEMWNLADSKDYDIALVLVDNNRVTDTSISKLKSMVSNGNAELYPLKYIVRIKERIGL